MNAIEIKGLCKSFGDFSLENLTLTLPCGCIMGLIGENGAGKSTAIRLMLHMLHKDSGSIRILGREETALQKDDIGAVLDGVGIPPCVNAKQLGKIMKLTYQNWDDAAYSSYLSRLEVPDNKRFSDLSQGMKMKLKIAAALSHHPKLLILDEATNGIDPLARDTLLDILMDFTREDDHSILISSHIVSDLEKICDYIAFLHKGKLLLCEEKDSLKERYAAVHCTPEALEMLPADAVLGRKTTPYGTEALVLREAASQEMQTGPVEIEQLFVIMAKEANQ